MRTLPDKVIACQVGPDLVDVDEAGYLFDPSDWSKAFAELIAAQEGLNLSDDHWQVVQFMRAYLEDHGVAADARFAIKFLADLHGLDKKAAKHLLFDLFPKGYVKQACKMSGMRQPRAWSTG